jgi:predicted ATPase
MLKRLYVDNFRCLVKFELRLDRMNLLLGDNGTGKTSVFDVLYRLQQFLEGNAKVLSVFPSADLSCLQTSDVQRFELDVAVGSDAYNYGLIIQYDEDRRRAKVKRETLVLGGRPLFDFEEGMVQFYHDDSTPAPSKYPFDWTQSGLAVIQPRPDNKKLTRFRNEVRRIIVACLNPHPALMGSETREEAPALSRYGENFVSWYRFVTQERTQLVPPLFSALSSALPGFSGCSLKEAGEARLMKVLFERPDGSGRTIPYGFNQLSDGQRMLIVLYSLLFGLRGEGVSLFLDEPDNFLALREIQPWLTALSDSVGEGIEQAVLISHHPEVINYLAAASGRWFEREADGSTGVSDKPKATVEGLTMAEIVARGWEK